MPIELTETSRVNYIIQLMIFELTKLNIQQ